MPYPPNPYYMRESAAFSLVRSLCVRMHPTFLVVVVAAATVPPDTFLPFSPAANFSVYAPVQPELSNWVPPDQMGSNAFRGGQGGCAALSSCFCVSLSPGFCLMDVDIDGGDGGDVDDVDIDDVDGDDDAVASSLSLPRDPFLHSPGCWCGGAVASILLSFQRKHKNRTQNPFAGARNIT